MKRAVKETVHELGHTWGLGHCRNPRCIMFFSNTLHDTDVKGPGFCAALPGEGESRNLRLAWLAMVGGRTVPIFLFPTPLISGFSPVRE